MEKTDVIVKPLVTEKTTFYANEYNRIAFEVDGRATKPIIKKAVEELYKVRVLGVATKVRKGQLQRNRFGYWKSRDVKQAVVKVHPEDKIELF